MRNVNETKKERMYQTSRKEQFIEWFRWGVANGDCDSALWMINYLNKRYEHNTEEKIWLCWLYGNTYYLPTSWLLKQEFPDEELASYERLDKWNTENYKRLRYQTDTKWSKGHLPKMYQSYHEWLGGKTQLERINEFVTDDEQETFDNLWKEVKKKWFKFGRYTAWFYLQTLKHTVSISMEPATLMLNDYSGSKSHRNGLIYALGLEGSGWLNKKLTIDQYQFLEGEASEILEECHRRFPELKGQMDRFAMETSLCSFKKLFRESRGRYMGYYLDRQSEEIMRVEKDGWFGVDWEVLWDGREEVIGEPLAPLYGRVDKSKMKLFVEEGRFHYKSDRIHRVSSVRKVNSNETVNV